LSWHTLSAFNTSHVLLFGGLPDPNSPTVIVNRADSAEILDISSHTSPVWIPEPDSWGAQPVRRVRLSTATSPNGLVFIFGGVRADGSQLAFSDHSYFSSSTLTFTPLPTSNAAPDLYGHASVILPDGRILVFGGYSPSQSMLLPLSTIWVLDPSTMQWTVVNTDTASLPSPRMAFAAVHFDAGKVIIHGGSNSVLQTNFADGWMLDTSKNPWTWSQIDALTQVGARRDHFAVALGGQVIFGFGRYPPICSFFIPFSSFVSGYLDNGPASATLQIYNPSSRNFVTTYKPSPTSTSTLTGSPHPPTFSGQTTSSGSSPTPSGSLNNDNPKSNATALVVGSIFGFLALVVVGLAVVYFIRKRRKEIEGDRQFMALGDEDDGGGGNPHVVRRIPAVRMHNGPERGILNTLGPLSAVLKMRSERSVAPRIDMFADEDARSFGEWYNNRRRDGRAGSSWSLRSMLGAGTNVRSRHPSGVSRSSWREKLDPFSDDEAELRDEQMGLIGAGPTRSRPRRDLSYQSSRSGTSYRDPFADPIFDATAEAFDSSDLYRDHGHDTNHHRHESSGGTERSEPPRKQTSIRLISPLQTILPVSQPVHQLSPLAEQASQSTLPLQTLSNSSSSQDHVAHGYALSPFDSNSMSPGSSFSSKHSPSVPPASPSILGASILGTNHPIKRSDSWWSRFARTTALLDRRSSGTKKAEYEIRDPNPPPKLSAIEERNSYVDHSSPHESSPDSTHTEKPLPPPKKLALGPPSSFQQAQRIHGQEYSNLVPLSRAVSTRIYGTDRHKSVSSLRTADSEAIERAGTMDVVQIARSRFGSENRHSVGGTSIDTHASTFMLEERNRERSGHSASSGAEDNLIFFASPTEEAAVSPSLPHPLADAEEHPARAGSPTLPASHIANRIRAYERRMSMEAPVSPPPTNTRHREERTKKRVEVKYGLAPKQSLFVANPDQMFGSSDS